jgi:hypothetical protein
MSGCLTPVFSGFYIFLVFQTKAAEWNIPPARVTDLTAALPV